jgi:peptidoglycan hydrolase CwlO-like protein
MTGPDPDDDDLADRVAALEQQQRADRRALGSLDADLSDLQMQRRQDVRLLQSLRDTQLEHGERLGRLESGQAALESGQAALKSGQAALKSGQAALKSGQAALESRLGQVESAVSGGFATVGARLDVIVELLRRD